MKNKIALLLALILCLGLATPAFAAQDAFSDVPDSHWAYAYIAEMSEKGVMEGTGGGFNPGGNAHVR